MTCSDYEPDMDQEKENERWVEKDWEPAYRIHRRKVKREVRIRRTRMFVMLLIALLVWAAALWLVFLRVDAEPILPLWMGQ